MSHIPEGFTLVSAEASQEQILQLIGASYETFTTLVMVPQQTRGRNVTDFIDADDTQRKELFSSIFGLTGYSQAYDLVHKELVDLKDQRGKLDIEISGVEGRISEKQKALEKEIVRFAAALKEFESEKISLQNRLEVDKKLLSEVPEHVEIPSWISEDLNHVSGEVSSLETSIGKILGILEAKEESKQRQNDVIHRLKTEISRLEGLRPVKPNFPHTLAEYEAQLTEVTEELEILQSGYEEELENDKKLSLQKADWVAKQSLAGTRRKTLQGNLDSAHKRLKELEEEGDHLRKQICFTCHQPLPASETEKQLKLSHHNQVQSKLSEIKTLDNDLAEVERELEVLSDELLKVDAEISNSSQTLSAIQEARQPRTQKVADISEAIKVLVAYEKANAEISKLSDLIQAKSDAEKLLLDLENSEKELVGQREAQKTKLDGLNIRYTDLKSRVTEITGINQGNEIERNRLAGNVNNTESLLSTIKPPVDGEPELQKELSDLTDLKQTKDFEYQTLLKSIGIAEDVKKACSPEGIVAELFREYIPQIEEESQTFLQMLTDGELEINFASDIELKKGGSKAKLDISVRNIKGGGSFDLLSGSEQNKAALAVSQGIVNVASRATNLKFNLRAFDEIFDSLDQVGMSRLSQVLNGMTDYGLITLVITHKVEMEDAIENKITVNKRDGVSYLSL